jgi:hypothetical protein
VEFIIPFVVEVAEFVCSEEVGLPIIAMEEFGGANLMFEGTDEEEEDDEGVVANLHNPTEFILRESPMDRAAFSLDKKQNWLPSFIE